MEMNIKYLNSKDLDAYDWFLLHLIFLNPTLDTSEQLIQYMDEDKLESYKAKGYISQVKKKKKSAHEYTTLRLTKVGKTIYRDTQILDYTEQDFQLLEYLKELYAKADKNIGNGEKVKKLLAWFRVQTTYSRKQIYIAVRAFIADLEDKNDLKYLPTLENLIWKGENVFSTKWTLSQSRLYQYIQENKDKLNAVRNN